MTHEDIQIKLAEYIRVSYPDTIFISDGAGVRMHPVVAAKFRAMQHGRATPDMFIAEPRNSGAFAGLFIEIKKDASEVYKKDGTLRKNNHIGEQKEVIDRLNKKGYVAMFGFGLDGCIKIIDNYMGLDK